MRQKMKMGVWNQRVEGVQKRHIFDEKIEPFSMRARSGGSGFLLRRGGVNGAPQNWRGGGGAGLN